MRRTGVSDSLSGTGRTGLVHVGVCVPLPFGVGPKVHGPPRSDKAGQSWQLDS